MKKILSKVLITSLIMSVVLGGISFVLYRKSENLQDAKQQRAEEELDLITEDTMKEAYERRKTTEIVVDSKKPVAPEKVYNGNYTEEQNLVIKKNKKKNLYDFESPMWIWDLYGTNHLSLYTYFKTTEEAYIRYTIQVKDDTIPNFTRTLNNDGEGNLTREHEYQITGFVPGMENLLIMEMYDENDEILNRKVFYLEVPKLSSGAKTKIEVSSGRSDQQISNGLYTIFGKKNIWLYDNSGVLRAEIPLMQSSSQNILEIEGGVYYATDKDQIVCVNRLGGVRKVYHLGKYEQYDEFMYNGYGSLWVLVTEPGKKSKSIRDTVISVDLKDKSVHKMFNMERLLPKMESKAKKEKGQKSLNWIDLNSIEQVNSDEVLVGSRELSSVFKIVNINSRSPRLSYIIGDRIVWKGTFYDKRVLAKVGQEEADAERAAEQAESILDLGEAEEVFRGNAGQTRLVRKESASLSEGQYYLYVWDSNYGYSPTRKDIKWSDLSGVGTAKKDARVSYIKKYLIDENNANYNIENEKEVSYTKTNGSYQEYQKHRIDNYGSEKGFAEYDSDGRMIRKFEHTNANVWNIEKRDWKNFWYY